MGFQSAFGSGSEADLAEDHHIPENLFREVICGRYSGVPEEGKERCLVGSREESPEGFGGFETKRLFADLIEFPDGPFFDHGCLVPRGVAGFELPSRVAKSGSEINDAVTEEADRRVPVGVWQESMFSADFPRLCDEMGNAALPVDADTVIGGIAVAHQGPAKVLSEDAFCHLGGPMPIGKQLAAERPARLSSLGEVGAGGCFS